MLFPKKVKHRKWLVGRQSEAKRNTPDGRGASVAFGSYGLKATAQARVRSNQIEAARRVISRTLGKTGKIWIRIFPDTPVTKKPAETRMGSGKGAVEYWVAVVYAGRILFEISGVEEHLAREALSLAQHKLPFKTVFVKKDLI